MTIPSMVFSTDSYAWSLGCPLTGGLTAVANNTRNQSELGANTCNRRQAGENACEQVTIGFDFNSD